MAIESQSDTLLVSIDGREALPVRAIPLVAPWDFLPPDELARNLRHLDTVTNNRFKELYAYHLVSGKPHRIEPWEWDSVLVDLSAFEARVRRNTPWESPGCDDEGYQMWRLLAVTQLPPGAFVWRADFEREFSIGWARWDKNRMWPEPIPRLNYSPTGMSRFREVVLEGFPTDQVANESSDVDDWESPIRYQDLPHRIAKLRFPEDSMRYGACRLELETEIELAVVRGELMVRNALTGGPLAQPYPGAVVLVDDLRPFLATRGISIPTQTPSEQEPALPEATELAAYCSPGIDTAALARALNGIAGRDHLGWKAKLSDPPKWMQRARLSRGLRGKAAATWDPICLVEMLVERKEVAEAEVKRLFRAGAVLESWRDEWVKRRSAFAMYGLEDARKPAP